MDDGLWHRTQALNLYTFGRELKNDDASLTQSQGESSLNPEAKEFVPSHKSLKVKEFVPSHKSPEVKEFVPSYKQKSEEKKTESTSKPTSSRREAIGDTDGKISQRDMQYINIQRQIFELLTELGDEQIPLDTVVVALLPNGRGLNLKFTTKEYVGGKNQLDEELCSNTCLTLHVNEPEEFASKPENVLVNQFLIRMNDHLSEKLEHTDAVAAPKCPINRNRSYTELEIEQQIEGIKVFDNFFNYTESMLNQERVTQKAFKELFHSLGMIAHRSCSATPVGSPRKSILPPSKAAKIDEDEQEAEEAYASSNESESEGLRVKQLERDLRGNQLERDLRKYMRDKLYRIEDDNGLQLVNQLSDADLQEMMPNDFEMAGPPSTPAICQTGQGNTPSYKSPGRKKCFMHSTLMSPIPAARCQKERVPSTTQKLRHWGCSIGSPSFAVTKKLQAELQPQFIATGVRTKTHQRMAKSGVSGSQQLRSQHASSVAAASTASRVVKTSTSGSIIVSDRAAAAAAGAGAAVTQKQRSNLAGQAPGNDHATNAGGVSAPKQNKSQGVPKKMLPRSTQTSLMRQLEVKRLFYPQRLSLMHGDSDHDLLFNEYLFK
ncbi:uncharacterized protein LOC6593917 isoform X1 [Drosophila persimilis]|uniref:uncharacterized protein LOC6593917 isoform X1 n=1 Tax=Drosophila persimilis TaxID=7234 RepID=UPI000F07A37E|nr:uncharacterized protein LOC6593917 isoform X1 [Drosophila persimilis]